MEPDFTMIYDYFVEKFDNKTLKTLFENNDSSVSRHFDRDEHLSRTLGLGISFGILGVLSLCFNSLICCIIIWNKSFHTVTNIFLANMAMSDILLVSINVPLNIIRNVTYEWNLGVVLCKALTYSLMISSYVSSFTLTAIAFDRQRVLLHPLKPRMTKQKGVGVIFVIWAVSITLALPYGLFNSVRDMDIFVVKVKRCRSAFPKSSVMWEQYLTVFTILAQYIIPLCIIGVAYIRVIHKLWMRNQLGYVTEDQRMRQIRAKRKSIKLLIAVVVVFAVCWMPLNLYHVLTDLHPNTVTFKYDSLAFFICLWVAVSSTCINPFLYCWINPRFRNKIVSKKSCCYKKAEVAVTSEEMEDLTSSPDTNTQETNVSKFPVLTFLKLKLDNKSVFC
ncbi:G-protein coupled receptor 83-like [Saccostrea echinata]|uniref:G-protein coupled receptor 83-like n=1 Tax=Saccostrea echinata TaxID=191078 RepID=UPI002A8067A2|nr:G-protein coupled receptor 83-like [Saccostrea echinata]